METNEFFGKENVWKILLKMAPPVMLAQLIQAVYNIVDSFLWAEAPKRDLPHCPLYIPFSSL